VTRFFAGMSFTFMLLILCAGTASAWGTVGHHVIALIAWDSMTEATRLKAVALMQQAPPEAGLTSLFPKGDGPLAERQRDFFSIVATWPDMIRNPNPASRHAFSRPTWHTRYFFWKQEAGRVVELPNMPVPAENAVERLEFFNRVLADQNQPASDRAIGIAWVLHLVGDVHQPLHCSARVTPEDPDGDRGGGAFPLAAPDQNLHIYWDAMVDKAVSRQSNETFGAYFLRVAAVIEALHPKASLQDELKPGEFEAWARESLTAAQIYIYPPSLRRGEAPDVAYREMGATIALKRAALSGYRLAAMLQRLLGE